MYSISVPPREIEAQPDRHPDSKHPVTPDRELKLVGTSQRKHQTEAAQEVQPEAADLLAAKILHLHAVAEDVESKEPNPIDKCEEPALDVPGILWRPKEDNGPTAPTPEYFSLSEDDRISSGALRNGPSFKALLISSLLIVAAGTSAIAVSMTDLLTDRGDGTRTVETQSITPEPTIESLIAESDAGASGSQNGAGSATNGAGGEQETAKAKAKAQIRKVLAGRDPATPAPANREATVAETPQSSQADKIQSRVAPRQVAGLAPATSKPSDAEAAPPRPEQNTPRLVDSTAGQPADAEPELMPSAPSTRAAPEAGEISAAPEQSEALSADPSFPTTGLVTTAVNMRRTADNDGEVIAVVPENTEIRFNECGPWWCNILYEDQSGFISEKYLQR